MSSNLIERRMGFSVMPASLLRVGSMDAWVMLRGGGSNEDSTPPNDSASAHTLTEHSMGFTSGRPPHQMRPLRQNHFAAKPRHRDLDVSQVQGLNLLNSRMPAQKVCHSARVLFVKPHPGNKRFDAPQDQPGIEHDSKEKIVIIS